MSISPARHVPSAEREQTLLALADGSFVLAGQTGSVAECGAGAATLLGVGAADAAGQAATALLTGGDAKQAAELDSLFVAGGETIVATGERSLTLTVVPVPLALGWDFTSMLSELGSRDPASWGAGELAARHARALDAIVAVTAGDSAADSDSRLAGILVILRETGAGPLSRDEVQEHVQRRREAARDAELVSAADGSAGGLEDLVEHARELRTRLQEAEATGAELRVELEAVVAERETLKSDLEGAHGDRDAARAELERALDDHRDASGTELRAIADERDAVRAEHDALRDERDALTAERDALTAERDELHGERAALRSALDVALSERDAARDELRLALGAAGALRAEFGLQPVAEAVPAPAIAELPSLPAVPGQATAYIGPDGCFERLDDAFCAMLGYREDELRVASWPSIIDRDNLDSHQELARRLREGEIPSADVETCYMHAHGLLVPVAGTVTRDDGDPQRLVFQIDLSRFGPGA